MEEEKTEQLTQEKTKNNPVAVKERENLELQLKEKGLLPVQQQSSQKYGKDFVRELRRAREFQAIVMYKHTDDSLDYNSIQGQLEKISIGNKKIEDQVKMDILGIQDSPLKKLAYHATQLFNMYIRGKPQERAEDLITSQIGVVDSVIMGLSKASDAIDAKRKNLENYYDRVFYNLLSKFHDRNKTLDNINETTELLSKTEVITKDSDDYVKKMMYSNAHRKLRKNLQSDMSELKLTDKAMLLLKNELPLVDNLGDISEAYSNALKETKQEATFMITSLKNLMELYFDIMRSGHVKTSLDTTLKTLSTRTYNMEEALRRCASPIVETANQSELFTNEYNRRAITLNTVLGDIEGSNSRAFTKLENRISGYLT